MAVPDGVAVKFTLPPTHAGASLTAVTPTVFTTTVVLAVAVQPGALAVTEYVPDRFVATLLSVGF